MDRKIIWSPQSEIDFTEILEFYYYKLNAKSYARKLNEIFKQEIATISEYPKIGKECNEKGVRAKIISHYQIIYELTEKEIYILRIWDSRQNPLKLSKKYRKK